MTAIHWNTFRLIRRYATYGGLPRQVAKTVDEHKQLHEQQPIDQPEEAKLLRVAIVGCPNAGKSTLLNQLLDWKVSAVSSKVHTTRRNVIGVYVHDQTQIEFIDTPGFVNRTHISRHKLDPELLTDLRESMIQSDVIAVLSDIANIRERSKINRGILQLLRENEDKESLLVLNKVDRIRNKQQLLDITATLTCGIVGGKEIRHDDHGARQLREQLRKGNFDPIFERTEKYLKYKDLHPQQSNAHQSDDGIGWPHFSQVFMISALHDDGVDQLRSCLLSKATHRPWLYSAQAVTTQRPKSLIFDCIREVCLEMLHQEIPYNIYMQIVMWQLDDVGNLHIVLDLFCPAKFQSLIIGPKGSTISTIVRKSRQVMCDVFHCDVSLKIAVKSK